MPIVFLPSPPPSTPPALRQVLRIPPSLGELKRLRALLLNDNQLGTLQDVVNLRECCNLTSLGVPLSAVPFSILKYLYGSGSQCKIIWVGFLVHSATLFPEDLS